MNFKENWSVRIQNQPTTILTEVWIYRTLSNGKTEILQQDFQTVVTIDPYEVTAEKPTMLLHPEILQAIVDKAKNLTPTPKQYVEGKLEATESHLSDLRQLLKLK